ncbi:Importin subunit alpha-4, partial [Mucuna pruriens]
MSLRRRSCSETRKKSFKTGIDAERSRIRREEDLIGIRKSKREDTLRKKRRQTRNDEFEVIPNMVQRLLSGYPAAQLQVRITKDCRRLSIDEIIKAGVVPRCVEFLTRYDAPQLQLDAVWVLSNLASGASQHATLVVELGAVPSLLNLLTSSTTDYIKELAVSALGNIAGDSLSYRDLVLKHDALRPLLYLLNSNSGLSLLRAATWSLSNLVRGIPPLNSEQVKASLTALGRLIYSTDEEVVTDACWALSYLSDGSIVDKIQAVIEAGVCPRLVELLLHPSDTVIVPALLTLGNILCGDDAQTQFVIDNRLLPNLLRLLTHEHKKSIYKKACWTISNITAGNRAQIQAIIDANFIPPLVNILQHAEFSIKKEAVWAIINITYGGTYEQIRLVVTQGCIKSLCDLLTCPDPQVVAICLEGLENILEVRKEADKKMGVQGRVNAFAQMVDECGGSDKIANLQTHTNNDIHNTAVMSLPPGSSFETRKKTYKSGIDSDQSRRRREDDLVGIRKNKRQDTLFKKRTQTHFTPIDDVLEAVRVLANVTSGTSEQVRLVVQLGAVPCFVNLLSFSTTDGVGEEVAWALGNIAADSPSNRDLVLNHAALWPLLYKLNSSLELSMLRVATWSLSNMVRGNPPLNFDQVNVALTTLGRLIQLNDEEVVTDACWALSYLSDDSFNKIQAIIEIGICPKLVSLLLHPSDTVIVPALRTLGNIVCGDDAQTQAVIDNLLLPCLHQLITNQHKITIFKEACWTISNITAGNRAQIQAVIDANIIPPLVHILHCSEFHIKKEAIWAIINIIHGGSHDQIRLVATEGCIKPLCDLLSCPDPQVVIICLEGLGKILELGKADMDMGVQGRVNIFAQMVDQCGGSDKIANLLIHDNRDIYNKAFWIFQRFWAQDLNQQDASFGVNYPHLPPGPGGFNFGS